MLRSHLQSRTARVGGYRTSSVTGPGQAHPFCAVSSARQIVALPHRRTLFGHGRKDLFAHIEQLNTRDIKHRTIRTKAKLLDKLRRRGKFDWDVSQRPFFTAKNLRWASHYRRRPVRATGYDHTYDESAQPETNNLDELEDGVALELSERERRWKEHLDTMRERVQQDPYEAVFGKRYEPFWSPLIPSWMRDDAKLQQLKAHSAADQQVRKPASNDAMQGDLPSQDAPPRTNPTQPYVYSTSAAWDSWTNKARRTEWDNVTGKVRRYEYDPISNRMIQVGANKPGGERLEIQDETCVRETEAVRTEPALDVFSDRGSSSLDLTRDSQNWGSVSCQKDGGIESLTPAQIRASMGKGSPAQSDSEPAVDQPASTLQPAIQRLKPNDDSSRILDADDSAAHESTEPIAQSHSIPGQWAEQVDILQSARVDRTRLSVPSRNAVEDPIFEGSSERKASASSPVDPSQNDRLREDYDLVLKELEQQKVLMKSHELRYSEKIRSLRQELDMAYKQSSRHSEIHLERIRKLEADLRATTQEAEPDLEQANSSINSLRGEGDVCGNVAKFVDSQQWYKRTTSASSAFAEESNAHAAETRCELPAEPERASSMDSRPISSIADGFGSSKDPGLNAALAVIETPTEYTFTADNLEKEFKTTSEVKEVLDSRYTFCIDDLPAELSATANAAAATSDRLYTFEPDQLTRNGSSCETSIQQEVPGSYIFKPDNLADELQSTIDAPKDPEKQYVFEPEAETSRIVVKPAAQESPDENYRFRPDERQSPITTKRDDDLSNYRYCGDNLAAEIGVKKHVQKDPHDYVYKSDNLESELRPNEQAVAKSYTIPFKADGLDVELAERKPGRTPPEPGLDYKFENDSLEKDLLRQVRRPAGKVDKRYCFEHDGLDEEIYAQEREAQLSLAREQSPAHGLEAETLTASTGPSHEIRDGKPVSTQPATRADIGTNAVEWQDPPAYKILAYNPGNDTMSIATTTSRFTHEDEPMTISAALSAVFQPARFVSHLDDLQREGYQVIYGTREMLVFRKLRSNEAVGPEAVSNQEDPSLVDHGLVKPVENALAQEAALFYDRNQQLRRKSVSEDSEEIGASRAQKTQRASINPIDLTTARHDIRPSTGNFASPTGFVNYDPIFPLEDDAAENAHDRKSYVDRSSARHAKSESSKSSREHIGSSRTQRVRGFRERLEERKRKRRHGAGAIRWALSVGITSAALCYVVGVATEASRQERRATEERELILNTTSRT